MRIFIGKLCVFVLLINFFCFPSDQHAAAYITDSRIVLANSVTPSDLSTATPQGQDSRDLARWDVYEIIPSTTFASPNGLLYNRYFSKCLSRESLRSDGW